MNLKKLPKEKQKQLILVALITLGAISGLGFGLIKYQYAQLDKYAQKKAATVKKLSEMRKTIRNSSQVEAQLAEARAALAEQEADMASGDLYSWMITTLRRFKAPYKVEIPAFSPVGPTTDMNMLPNFPYKQAALTVGGTAYFHDFGRFLADFENQFPHVRVVNLSLDANPAPGPEEAEGLSFKMEIVTLVKPTT
jgi:Tfp pilus assembly protein PilO